MELFVRESGAAGAPAIVFLHGGRMSGWSWEPVVERLQQYRCLVPDLPQFGGSFEQGPFEMGRAADAVAELIRSRVDAGRAHVVGFSLGAQVGVQLLATEPKLVDRAVLCGTSINTLPGVRPVQLLSGQLARTAWFRWVINRRWSARYLGVPDDKTADYADDVRLTMGAHLAHIVVASAGFTAPAGLDNSEAPTLFLTGGREMPFVRHWAAALAGPMPRGADRVALGMRHDWPLRNPDLFSRTVTAWLSDSALPAEIVPANQLGSRTGRPAAR